jgi:uncharacterized cupin superfamily protein
MAKRIDPKTIRASVGSDYPPPHGEPCAARIRRRLGDVAGLTNFGVNLLRLPPGTWSSRRHWHTAEGEVVLVTDAGEETLRPGECAGFKAGAEDGHHLQNRSQADVVLLEVGSRKAEDAGDYPDIDMRFSPHGYTRKDGSPFN